MHFHELRFLEFAKRWWWQRGMLLENSTHAGAGQAAQRPAGLLRAQGASQPSLSATAQTGPPPLKQKAKEIFSMPLLVERQTGWLGGKSVSGRGRIHPGVLCGSPSGATHRQTRNNENKKIGGCPSRQFLSTSLPFGLSHPRVNSHSNQSPSMFIRQLF